MKYHYLSLFVFVQLILLSLSVYASCLDPCSASEAGKKKCVVGWGAIGSVDEVRECKLDSSGCYGYKTVNNCKGIGLSCSDKNGILGCFCQSADVCLAGQKRCLEQNSLPISPAGPDQIQQCKSHGCGWNTLQSCTMQQDCVGGSSPSCVDKQCPYCCPAGKTCSVLGNGVGCSSGTCCYSESYCTTPAQACTGTCKTGQCPHYSSCSTAVGICSIGNCCSGSCTDTVGYKDSPFGFLGQYIDNPLTQQLNSAYGGYPAILGFYKDLGVHWDRGAGRSGGAVWGAFKNPNSVEYETYPAEFDGYVASAQQNNIHLLITIIQAYANSQNDAENGKKFPADPDGFISFVKELVRNHPYVKYWQLDNEINNGVWWKDTPQNYARLLRLTSDVIRETCSDCKVVLGSSININGPGDPLPVELYFEPVLKELSKYGKNYFDVFDYHFFPPKGYTPESYYLAYAQGVASTRNLLDKYGYSGAEIWTTETMIPTTDGMSQSQIQKLFPEYRTITEKQQAKALFKTYVSGLSAGVKKIFWTKLIEGPVFDFMFNRAGLIRHPSQSGSTDKKLSYFTYKKMVEMLEGSDWKSIQKVQESDGVHVYKLTKNGKPIWAAWNDNANEKQINVSGIPSDYARITEALPKYESGSDVTDYGTAFKREILAANSNSIAYTLGDVPVFIEGTGATPQIGIAIEEMKSVLIDMIASYFSSSPTLTTAEIKDLIVAYFSAAGSTADMSITGQYSGEKLIDIYSKAKGTSACTPSCAGKCGGASDGCGGTCNVACAQACTNKLDKPLKIAPSFYGLDRDYYAPRQKKVYCLPLGEMSGNKNIAFLSINTAGMTSPIGASNIGLTLVSPEGQKWVSDNGGDDESIKLRAQSYFQPNYPKSYIESGNWVLELANNGEEAGTVMIFWNFA